MNQDNQLQGES